MFPRKLRDGYCIINRCKWWGNRRSEFLKLFVGSMCLSSYVLSVSTFTLYVEFPVSFSQTTASPFSQHAAGSWPSMDMNYGRRMGGSPSNFFLITTAWFFVPNHVHWSEKQKARTVSCGWTCKVNVSDNSRVSPSCLSERNDENTTDGIFMCS